MQKAIWLAAIVIAITAFGCERKDSIPEPKIPEKAQLPAVNERIEREVEQGTRTGIPPATEQPGSETDPPATDRGKNP